MGGAGAGSNAWATWLGDDQDVKIRVRSGGVLLLTAPLDGIRVAAGEQDVLHLEYDGSAASGGYVDVDVVLLGIDA